MQLYWQGYYLDGVTAVRQPVNITLTPSVIQIAKEDKTILLWQYEKVTQTQGFYSGEPVRLEFNSDPIEAIVLEDVEFLHSLRYMSVSKSVRFLNPAIHKKNTLWILIVLFFSVIILAIVYLWGIPALAVSIADKIPPQWEAKLGDVMAKDFIGKMPICNEALLKEPVDKIMQRLNSAAQAHPYTFHIYIVKSDDINAFAFPGGYLVLFSKLIEQTESPEELAGVLAHEMQHLMKKHATRNIFQNLSFSILFSLMLGDMGAIGDIIQTTGTFKYSRKFEEDADISGMDLILKAKIDPKSMASFFDSFDDINGERLEVLKYLSTHPVTSERIKKLNAQAEQSLITPVPLLPDTSWQDVKMSCH